MRDKNDNNDGKIQTNEQNKSEEIPVDGIEIVYAIMFSAP